MLQELITEIQCLGVRVREGILHRRGGAGPADAGSLLIEGIPVNVPVSSGYVGGSPYAIKKRAGRDILFKERRALLPARFISKPLFYDGYTEEGVPYWKIALLHGKDCLATSVIQTCLYWSSKERCRFCGIELSLENMQTIREKTPEQLTEVARQAKEGDGVGHVVLTSGTANPPGREISLLARCASAIKGATGLPLHIQCLPPSDPERFSELKEAGVDTVGIHIESFDLEILSKAAPVKARLGLERYLEAWRAAVHVFGANQVSSFLLVGLGERAESVVLGSEVLADLGVYPFVLPLRPIPGSWMENTLPPDPDVMKRLYERVARVLERKGLSSSQSLAGCVRCGACSALPLFEKGLERVVCHPVRTERELAAALEIRKEVFVKEQKMFEVSDRDEKDVKSIHLLAEADGNPIGTVRVYPANNGNGHWVGGRLSVKKPYRTSGAGERLVREAVKYVKGQGCTRFTARIQAKNVPFFLRLGWKRVGRPAPYCGRLHQLMEADLAAPDMERVMGEE
jgi:radical SAM protein (TIGR04043 family)/putative N-acetyltransferase (TIGR04045 family)